MPIYAYKCESCGHAKDVLQKISDPALTVCPACNASAFQKQLTAAGFQLKGSGWYVTDFRGGTKSESSSAEGSSSGTPAAAPAPVAAEASAATSSSPAATAPGGGTTSGASTA
jgi:putative FmdB family regulatory protein